MISAVGWIPRGGVRRIPIRQELAPEELAQLRRHAATEEATSRGSSGGGRSRAAAAAVAARGARRPKKAGRRVLDDPAFASLRDVPLPPGLDLDEDLVVDDSDSSSSRGSDAEEEDDDEARAREFAAVEVKALGERMADLSVPAAFPDDEGDDEDVAEESDDLAARASDAFLLVATTEEGGEYSSLEVHCYDTATGALYVHHDIALPAFPLALAWMDYAGDTAAANAALQSSALAAAGQTAPAAPPTPQSHVGSYVAVGTFKPDIEIWNTDVLDALEPSLVLKGGGSGAAKGAPGARSKGGKAGKGKGGAAVSAAAGAPGATIGGHTDAVMSLGWNRGHRHLLASGSADTTARVWDLDRGGVALHAFTHHSGKVSGIAWNPVEASVLATASYDRTAAVVDARASGGSARVARYALPGDPEAMLWYPHNPALLMLATDDGSMLAYDVRSPAKPLWSVRAHSLGVTSLAASHLAAGLVATGSLDKSVKLWDVGGSSAAPTLVATKTMSIGQVFALSFNVNEPFLLGAGGSKGVVAVWDIAMDGGDPATAASAPLADQLDDARSATARHFASRVVDGTAVPTTQVRPRSDGQPLL